jgi:hypothetical protein
MASSGDDDGMAELCSAMTALVSSANGMEAFRGHARAARGQNCAAGRVFLVDLGMKTLLP